MTEPPPPFTSPEIDLDGMPGFMLDTEKLRQSELWALSSGEEFKAAVGLWCRAWVQKPAGSLPNDERLLAAWSGAGRRWTKVRDMALRGFVLCSDGRLYHPVLCQDARRAWGRRTSYRERASNAAAARWGEQKQSPSNASSMLERAQGQGRGRRQGNNTPPSPAAPGGPPPAAAAAGLRAKVRGYDPAKVLAACTAGDLLALVAAFGGNLDRGDEWARDAAGQTIGAIAAVFDWRMAGGQPIREPSGLRAALAEWNSLGLPSRRAYAQDFAKDIGLPVLSPGAERPAGDAA